MRFNSKVPAAIVGAVAVIALVAAAGCSREKSRSQSETMAMNAASDSTRDSTHARSDVTAVRDTSLQVAFANLEPTQGNSVRGIVTFTQERGTMRVMARVTGLTPGPHGFHIHQNGDCSSPDASSAGGHFNPTNMQHGNPKSEPHHMGDLGNITADAQGLANYELADSVLTFDGPNSIIGKAVIVHANPDDYLTQPSGNSGPRVACGVIERRPIH